MIRKYVVQQICSLFDTIQDGIDYISTAQGDTAELVLENCQYALHQILQTIQQEKLTAAEYYIEKVNSVLDRLEIGAPSDCCQIMKQQLEAVRERLQQEPVRLEIAFLPYKFSMWDSMDSVWRAAAADPMCDCYVVPIPYYDRNPDHSFGKFHYEGTQFPEDIPVVDYASYHVAERKPDIVYIHNPYDAFNHVTSVDPHYYSHELKKHTGMLVYIPYYVAGSSKALGVQTTLTMLSAYRQADRIIVQSDGMKRGLIDLGISEACVMALGTPKLDYVVHHQPGECPPDWRKKLQGKTVFLVNSSLTDLLRLGRNWLLSIKALLIGITADADCAVIWRPHPLTEATVKSMRTDLLQLYQDMKAHLLQLDNFIYDENSNYLSAFDVSHALITDYSSLPFMYGVTKKPILFLTGSQSERESLKYNFIDYYDCYFQEDGLHVTSFVNMVKKKKDPLQQKRLASLFGSLINADGTAGEKIHAAIVEAVKVSEQQIVTKEQKP